jgi:hypothetical protein
MLRTSITNVALWLHDRQCASRCTGPGRTDHANRTQRKLAKKYTAATSLEELATLLHNQMCSAWIERAHGSYYIDRSERFCGAGGQEHIARLVSGPTVAEIAKLIGLSEEAATP